MSFSDSESQNANKEYKFFRDFSRDRLLHEMLGSTRTDDPRSAWKVLIMDRVTMKVMSHSCKMSDITDQGISLVEDLFRRREPLPSMDAIYFIQPSKENIVMFLSDMSGREPLYNKAYVFFSSTAPKDIINHIKSDVSVLPRIGAFREMNLEYFSIDSQAFMTDQDDALRVLYSVDADNNSRRFESSLNLMATRIATVFASLKELPNVRYRAPKASEESTFRDSIPTKLATAVWNMVSQYKSIPNFPQTETCELLILDRTVDHIAPVIHEWTYDAMCHDLLEMDGNKYVIEVPSKSGGPPQEKEVLLEDNDPVWLELRHVHIADASERLYEKMTTFTQKNKAAQMQQNKDGGEISTRELQKIVQALPKYNEMMEKLQLHVEIAGQINLQIRDMGLRDLGQLEQDLVFGDAGAKEVISYLRTNKQDDPENKLRLLMIYAFVYPEKFEGDKGLKLMQLAKLSDNEMQVVRNMQMLVGSTAEPKKPKGNFSLKFDNAKTKHAARTDKTEEEEQTWQLFRFFPVLEELLQKLNKGDLAKSEYVNMNEAKRVSDESNNNRSSSKTTHPNSIPPTDRKIHAQSRRSRRTPNWAKQHHSDDGYSSDSMLKSPTLDPKKMGQRIFVFIIGGATRSELRVCHKLTTKLRREVVLGCTSLDDPQHYLEKLKLLTEPEAPSSTTGHFPMMF
ncbi:Protein transport Sec1a [Linum perenne]